MRFTFLLPAALLAMGCGVPDVTFTPDSGRDASGDGPPVDGQAEAAVDGEADGESDAGGDSGDAPGDAPSDAPEYCKGDAGPPAGPMYKCCGSALGTVCSGNCNQNQCLACGVCAWPSVCCPTMGDMGHCSGQDGGC
jgi:hypothetical protein